ncbi:MAG: arylsulfatase [Planctomycetaceae bacterium]
MFRLTAFALFTVAAFSSCLQAAGKTARPNIVLILCDDMGFSDIGCYGGEVQTPNIDGLAAEGLRFKQFYNNAKCTTTRASLITGLYPRRRGPLLKSNMVTIAEVLKAAGYRAALSGKWHLGNRAPRRPSDRGFDRYFGLLDGCCNFFDPSMPDPKFKGGRVRWVAQDDKRITTFPKDFYMTDAISDYAVKTIGEWAKPASDGKRKPFFLHVCYTAPHYPLHAKAKDIAKYKGTYLKGWHALRNARHRRQLKMGLVDPNWKLPGPEREVQAWKDAPHKDWQDLRMAVYAAMIDSMDQGIGRILKALKDAGVDENTLVMFLSDNGGCAETPGGNNAESIPGPKQFYTHCGPGWAYAQNTPFRRYKSWVHEGGISTPFIARWPGRIKPNTWTNEAAHIIDLLPTCAEVGRATYPKRYKGNEIIPVEGVSFLSVLSGKPRVGHDVLYWEWARNRAVRAGKWKLCWDRKVKRWELYDVVADRTEMNDLASEHPERVARLSKLWFAWAKKTGLRVGQRKKRKKKSP